MRLIALYAFVSVLSLSVVPDAHARRLELPQSLAEAVLSESIPTAFAPDVFTVKDFAFEWLGDPIPGVQLSLKEESLEWVRVADLFVFPRAKLIVNSRSSEGGLVKNAGFTQPISPASEGSRAELPFALLSGPSNPIEITVLRSGVPMTGKAVVRFNPRVPAQTARVYTDPSCSRFRVVSEVLGEIVRDDNWAYIGCRLVYVDGALASKASLEMFVYWDNVGQVIEVEGVKTSSTRSSLWPMRLRSIPGQVSLRTTTNKTSGQELKIHYAVPERAKKLSIGLGMGPYSYTFYGTSTNQETFAPLVTFYGSYLFTETVRIVAFNAMPLNSVFYSDLGLYISSESFRFLDDRLALNLMIGGHVITFNANEELQSRLGAPQGFELVFTDALMKGRNLSAGAFIYPAIQGRSYYNIWFRWGSSRLFGEFNYIGWQETMESGKQVYSRSVGFSLGFPLFQVF